ncbi:pilus assembly protein TadG-related protein [Novosphingobium bradum]|uniref:Pilus assembly protein TadG-related protein n=1 Tax=Novosphingobium bradum TaxID=1737444 RepID=A0ABV7ISP6_9SPHN
MTFLRALVGDRTANATVFVAMMSLLLIGAAGAASDTIQWTLLKRKLQRQADSAALSGAMARMSGGSVTAAANAEIARYTAITLQGSPTIENAPSTGAYAGNAMAVRVKVTANASLPFSQIFLGSAATMTAESTAMAVGNGDYCVLALETIDATGIKVSGNATATLGCGMATNAQGTKAIEVTGSSTVTATSLMAVGNISVNGNGSIGSTALLPYALVQSDPFASLPTPAVPTGCTTRLRVNPNETLAVANPTGTACYAEMDLKGTVTFAPGIYILNGGDLKLNATADVSGTGVVFILTSDQIVSNPSSVANLSINGGARFNVSAPTSGAYAGIFLYQDRRAADDSGTNDVSGNSTSFMQGTIYFPAQRIKFTGNSGMNTNCLQIVARRVEFTGSNTVTNTCPANSGAGSFSGYQVRLVN